jgi:hypothetical protein
LGPGATALPASLQGHACLPVGPRHLVLFMGQVVLVSVFVSNSFFFVKTFVVYFLEFIFIISCIKKTKDVFAKNSVTFCRFILYMVRLRSKNMSKELGKVDVFWIH